MRVLGSDLTLLTGWWLISFQLHFLSGRSLLGTWNCIQPSGTLSTEQTLSHPELDESHCSLDLSGSPCFWVLRITESPSCGSSFLHMHNQCQVTVAEQWKGMATEWKMTGGVLNPILTKFNWANPVVDLWTIKSRRDEYGCLSSFLIVPKSVSRWHHLPIQLTHMVCHQTAPNTLWWQQWQLEM